EGAERQSLISRAAYAIPRAVRSVDFTAVLEPKTFGLCLLNCTRQGAEIAEQRLERVLGDIPCSISRALFPDDNLEADELLKLAINRSQSRSETTAAYESPTIPRWPGL